MKIILTNAEILKAAETLAVLPIMSKLLPSNLVLDKFESKMIQGVRDTKAVNFFRNREDEEFTIEVTEEFILDVTDISGDIIKGIFSIAKGFTPAIEKLNIKYHTPHTVYEDKNQISYYKTTSNIHSPITFMKSKELCIGEKVLLGVMVYHNDNSISTIPAYIPNGKMSSYRVEVDENDILKLTDKIADWTWVDEFTAIDSLEVGDRSFHYFNDIDSLKEFVINWQ